jgi:hypothetical protein
VREKAGRVLRLMPWLRPDGWLRGIVAALALALLFAAFHALVLGANPMRGETVAASTLLQDVAGWSRHRFESDPTHPERTDTRDLFIPQWTTAKQALRNGESPLWNPLPQRGHPGILDLSRGMLTPAFAAFAAIDADWLGYYFAGLVSLVIASLGTALFLLRFLGLPAALFGAASYALCGFNTAWFYWPQLPTAAWIPWVLWATAAWCQSGRPRWLAALALLTALLMVGGFPAVSVYGLYAATLLLLVLVVRSRDSWPNTLSAVLLWGGAVVTGFLLVAMPLLATLEMLSVPDLSHRVGGTVLSFPSDLKLLIAPHLHGLPLVERTMYTGVVALMLAMIASISTCLRPRLVDGAATLTLFALPLLLASLFIAFGLAPHDWLRALPGVGTSSWNRFVVLVGLAVAVLGACGFDLLWRRACATRAPALRCLAVVVLLALGLVQAMDQTRLFRSFNTVAVAADFSPATPTIEYVRSNLTPTQSVIADEAFLTGGTLGAWGIAEWLAHGFRTREEMAVFGRLVHEPFPNPISTRFPGEAIWPDADLYARLGIRYVLTTHAEVEMLRVQLLGGHVALPPMPRNALSQRLHIETPIHVDAIGLVLATYNQPRAPGDVTLEVIDANGRHLGAATLEAGRIRDNQNAVFRFVERLELEPGEVELRLQLHAGPDPQGALTAWYAPIPRHVGDRVKVNDEIITGAMLYSLYVVKTERFAARDWRHVRVPDDDIDVFENRHAPAGAYRVDSLEPQAPWSESGVVTGPSGRDVVRVRHDGSRGGHIVVPMRHYPGWVAYVDGVEAPIRPYLGIMPSVAVSAGTPQQVELRYEPDWSGKGAYLMLLGLVLLAALPVLSSRLPHGPRALRKTKSLRTT